MRTKMATVLALSFGAMGFLPLPAHADLPYGPDTCKDGYVWREASPSDHVCVPPASRDRAADNNAQAMARRSPAGGAYGPILV